MELVTIINISQKSQQKPMNIEQALGSLSEQEIKNRLWSIEHVVGFVYNQSNYFGVRQREMHNPSIQKQHTKSIKNTNVYHDQRTTHANVCGCRIWVWNATKLELVQLSNSCKTQLLHVRFELHRCIAITPHHVFQRAPSFRFAVDFCFVFATVAVAAARWCIDVCVCCVVLRDEPWRHYDLLISSHVTSFMTTPFHLNVDFIMNIKCTHRETHTHTATNHIQSKCVRSILSWCVVHTYTCSLLNATELLLSFH